MALAFARAGADVVVAARTDQEGGPLPGTIYQTDVSQDEQVEEMEKDSRQERSQR